MEIFGLLALSLVMIIGLVKSADFIEESFVFLSSKVKVSPFFTGFALLGLASNLPELAIILSGNASSAELSVGTLLGSSLIALTFIIGLFVVKTGQVDFKGRFGEREVLLTLLSICLMVFVLLDQRLGVIDGILLICAYLFVVGFVFFNFSHRKPEDSVSVLVSSEKVFRLAAKGLIGIVGLLITANILVDSVVQLTQIFNINQTLVGIAILGVGTNSPEIAILVRAKAIEQKKLAFGNFVGSAFVISGFMGILGVTSGGVDITSFISMIPALVLIVFSVILFAVFSWTGRSLSKNEGYMLIAAYSCLIISEMILLFTL